MKGACQNANTKHIFWHNNKNVQRNRWKAQFTHIHAEYGDDEAVFDLEGNKLEGKLPSKKERMVQTWIDIHQEDLQANWKLLQSGEQFFKIPPLQ